MCQWPFADDALTVFSGSYWAAGSRIAGKSTSALDKEECAEADSYGFVDEEGTILFEGKITEENRAQVQAAIAKGDITSFRAAAPTLQ